MKLFSFAYAGSTIFRHIFYSLLMHTLAVSSLFALPLYSNKDISEQDNWYFINLENEVTAKKTVLPAKANRSSVEKSNSKNVEEAGEAEGDIPRVSQLKSKPTEITETKKTTQVQSTTKTDAASKKINVATANPSEDFAKPPAVKDVSVPPAPKRDERPAKSDAAKKPAVTTSVVPIEEPVKSLYEIKRPLPTEETPPPTPDAKESGIALMQAEPKGDVIAKILSASEQSVFKEVLSTKPKEEKNTTVVANGDKKPLPDFPVEEKKQEPQEDLKKGLKPAEPEAVVAKNVWQDESSSATSDEKASKSNQMYKLSLPPVASKIALRSSIPAIRSNADLFNQNMKQGNDNNHKKKMTKAEEKNKAETEKKIFKAIPVMNKPVLEDIKIEVDLEGDEMPFVSMGFIKKRYAGPQHMDNIREEQVDCSVDMKLKAFNMSSIKHIYSVLTADNGIYAFVMENKGKETYKANILFRIYEGQEKERIKAYKNIELKAGNILKFKFILPYTVFWDDDVFSLTMEDSTYLTKVHKELGLVWKEFKERKSDY